MLAVSEARARILGGLSPTPIEERGLADAHGLVLAAPVVADRDQPPAAMSAMDGYAVRAADLAQLPARLEVIGAAPAGQVFAGALAAGQALRIFTGAAIPASADTVVIQENTAPDGDRYVLVRQAPAPGANIRRQGNDFANGQSLLPPGRRLDARAIGLAAAGGAARVRVHRRPRIAFLSTGDELVASGHAVGAGQIVNSNGPMMQAFIAAAGGVPIDLGIAGDTAEELLQAAARFSDADLVLTIGGASVGEHDLVQRVLAPAGLAVDFWKIAMRPGKPLIHGHFKGVPFLGLPGNPVSAFVCAKLFLEPAIAVLGGGLWPGHDWHRARLANALPENGPREHYLRGRLRRASAQGEWQVDAASVQDSAMLSILADSNALIMRPPNAAAANPGDWVAVLPL
ncbi:MAG: molybdopterin molybdotransferase MoeA [Sphingomonadales bacterium]